MKISTIVFLVLLVGALGWMLFRFFYERRRQQTADKTGTVVYATFVSSEPVTFFGKPQGDLAKITLRLQEPGAADAREVTLRTRLAAGQKMQPGMRIPVVIDPKNADRVYPASPESAKRAIATGSRMERRVMESQLRSPGRKGPQVPSGYQPPQSTMRRR